LSAGEEAGAFERDVDRKLAPRQLRRILDGGDLDRPHPAIEDVALDRDLAGKAAVHRVVAQQMRVGFRRGEIVDGDHGDVAASSLHDGAQHIAADPTEPVDGYPN